MASAWSLAESGFPAAALPGKLLLHRKFNFDKNEESLHKVLVGQDRLGAGGRLKHLRMRKRRSLSTAQGVRLVVKGIGLTVST